MRSTRWIWSVIATLALGIGLLAFPGHSPAQTDDRDDDDAGAGKKKVIRIITTDDEEEAGEVPAGGYLGVQVQDLTRQLKIARDMQGVDGALVNQVEDESPADRAGIRKGDVIVRVGRTDTPTADALTKTVRSMKPGEKVPVVVARQDGRHTLTVVLGTRPRMERIDLDLPDMREFHWEGDLPPRARMFLQQREDMKEELEQLRDEIGRLSEEIRQLRLELQKRPARPR
jgi:membrane-associated protease RseP (regulator of RpoE activity)